MEVPHWPHQLPQAMGWKVASGIRHWQCPRADLDTSALSEVPSPALAIPSSRSKAKSGQRNGGCSSLGPAPSPQTAPRGAASKGESRDRTRSPQPPWRHHERWGQCTELLSGGIRNGAGQSSGDSRQRAAGAWGRPARGAGTSPPASGSPAPGWERSAWRGLLWGHPKAAVPRAGSARQGRDAATDTARSRGRGVAAGTAWVTAGAKWAQQKMGWKLSRGAGVAAARPAGSPRGPTSACHTAGGGRWRGRSSLPP